MINLTNIEKERLLNVASNLSVDEIEMFHRAYIDKEIPIQSLRAVRFFHEELAHIIDAANAMDADFILSHEEEKALNDKLIHPIDIVWEGVYQKTKQNDRCILNWNVPQIHAYINKLLAHPWGRDRYIKAVAYIYNYLVKNKLEDRAVNIHKLKENLMNIKKQHTPLEKVDDPKGKTAYLEQHVPF